MQNELDPILYWEMISSVSARADRQQRTRRCFGYPVHASGADRDDLQFTPTSQGKSASLITKGAILVKRLRTFWPDSKVSNIFQYIRTNSTFLRALMQKNKLCFGAMRIKQ